MRSKRSSAQPIDLVLGSGLLVGAVVVLLVFGRMLGTQSDAPSQVASDQRGSSPPGFHDVAEASGLDFHMHFLEGEQGENFKVNLYDHGCGLAVGDYDGDGDDDVFFLNQLGANALYRNSGDGSFERVTDDNHPLALADRICV